VTRRQPTAAVVDGGDRQRPDRAGHDLSRSEFRVGNKTLLLDDAAQKHGGADDRHLAFDHRVVEPGIGEDRFGAGRLFALRIEQHLRRRGVERCLPQQRDDPDHQDDAGHAENEFPLAPREAQDFAQIETMLALPGVEHGRHGNAVQHLLLMGSGGERRGGTGLASAMRSVMDEHAGAFGAKRRRRAGLRK
jgi:hypothetical protein